MRVTRVWLILLLASAMGALMVPARGVQPVADDSKRGHELVFVTEAPEGTHLRVVDEETGESRIICYWVESYSLSPDGKSVAFSLMKGLVGESGIYVSGLREPRPERLVSGNIRSCSWSPDGGRLCYSVRKESAGSEIWMIDTASKKAKKVADSGSLDPKPKWSPQGDLISYISSSPAEEIGASSFKCTFSLMLVRPQTGETIKLCEQQRFIEKYSWSSDGKAIALVHSLGSSLEIVDANGNGTEIVSTDLLWSDFVHTSLSWSPDGERIAFAESAATLAQVVVVSLGEPGKSKPRRTTIGPGLRPRWSPDGTSIAFSRDIGICVSDPEGNHQRKVAEGVLAVSIAWSPDSKRIAFLGPGLFGGKRWDVYSVAADGTGLRRLTYDGMVKDLLSYVPE